MQNQFSDPLVENDKVNIVTTLFPLYEFAREVGGDKAQVYLLLPPGAEPHTFDPRPSDIVRINNADIFVYVGAGMEPWAEKIIDGTGKNFMSLEASSKVKLIKSNDYGYDHDHEHDDHEHDHDVHNHDLDHEHDDHEHDLDVHDHDHDHDVNEHDNDGHGHQHGEYDPHIWLSFENNKKIVDAIALALIQKDPENRDYYMENAKRYKKELDDLDARYDAGLKDCHRRVFVTGGHSAYAYLAHRYDFSYVSAHGVSPDSEPTPHRIKKITDIMKEHDVGYVLMEELVNPRLAQALSQESGAKVLVFNPAANLKKDQFDGGVTFISLMDSNLLSLKKALECG